MPSRRYETARRISMRRLVQSLRHGVLSLLVSLLTLAGCGGMPLEQQQQHIRDQDLQIGTLTAEAFLTTWGSPTYQYEGPVQFYPLYDGQLMPGLLVPIGEAPKNWDDTIVSGPGRIFAYADHGEVLGFLENRLVYRAQASSANVHELGKAWASEKKFRTRTEIEFLQKR